MSIVNHTTCVSFCAMLTAVLGGPAARAQQPDAAAETTLARGEKIYASSCVECHGARGEGVEDACADPLSGDASIGELTKLITDTMPDGEPERCVGEDAQAVAEYIHHAFYSEAARVRNRPPRIRLGRLTTTQLRNSLADLYTRQPGTTATTSDQGLKAQYYADKSPRRDKLKFERTDRTIDFDFADAGPGQDIDPSNFSVVWRGGLRADTTGRYEIVVRSSCAFVFDLGSYDREFINNHVQSGDQTEFRKSIVLTGGRVYPLEIRFVQRKRKTRQPPARISLSWIRPHGIEEIIPARHLVPDSVPATFSLQTPLPPDDRSYGFARGIAIDRQWDDATTAAALEFADMAIAELWPEFQRRHRKEPNQDRAHMRAFLRELLETAFRGPVPDEVRKLYIDRQITDVADDREALRQALLAILKSPRFLYPLIDSDHSPSQRAANRLALTLFDSLPADQWLLEMVKKGQLDSEKQIRMAAERMLQDDRARAKTREFLYEWLNLSRFEEISKSSEAYPDFNAAVVADLRTSLDLFLDDVVWNESSDYRRFFLADRVFTTPRLHEFYGNAWAPGESDGDWPRLSVPDAEHRFGLLTHPYLLSGLAYSETTSPIHRGVFLIRYMLGRTLKPPASAFTPLSPDLHPDLTTRQRVALQTSPKNCQTCHTRINGLGFVLENYDAVGRYREQERNKPIDPTGLYTTRRDELIDLAGPRQLAEFLANSDEAHGAFVSRAFQHFVKQPVAAYGLEVPDLLAEKFRSSDYNIQQLLVEIAVIAARNPTSGSPAR